MTSRLNYLVWIFIALACGTVLAEEPVRWAPDIATARQASAKFKVPLLIHFYGDNCLPCKTLEQRVLNQPEVIQTLNKYFICVRVNATRERQTAAEFQVHSWPTDVFVSPDGKTLHQGVCPQDLRGYMGILENIMVMNRDRNVMLAAAKPEQPSGITQQTATIGNNNMQPQLPPPGVNLVTSSQTPSYYTGQQAEMNQQLAASTSPAPGVQSGPIHPSQQPTAINGSTPAASQQLSGPTPPSFMNTPNGRLPDLAAPVAQLASPASSTVPTMQPNLQAYTPTVPQPPQNQPAPPAFGTAGLAGQATAAQMVNNPHYPGAATTTPGVQPPAASFAANASPTNAVGQPAANKIDASPVPWVSESKVPAQQVSFQPRNDTQQLAAAAAQPAATASTAPGMDGYCPIALKRQGQWLQGNPQYAVKHRGKMYWMSSPQAMQEFLQAPDKASPVLGGYDPMVFLNEGRLVEGQIQFGLLEEVSGNILFFTSAESKARFEQNYDQYAETLEKIMQQAAVGSR